MRYISVFSAAVGLISVFSSKAQEVPRDLDQARDFMVVKSEIVNRLGPTYRSDAFIFDESQLDKEVLRAQYLYEEQRKINPYQYPTISQLFYKKKDLYDYIYQQSRYHEHWVTYASRFLKQFNVHEYDKFVNFSSKPFSAVFKDFLDYERMEVHKWRNLNKAARKNPEAFLLKGPFHPHKITGVDKLHDLGINGEGTETIVWDCGFVQNNHLNYSGNNDHVKMPLPGEDVDMDQIHGTHVAGIVAADEASGQNKGVAYNGRILPISFNGVEGLFQSMKNSSAKIISASFHYLVDRLAMHDLDRLAEELEASDRLLVMAAGNEGDYMEENLNPNFLYYWEKGLWMGTHSAWILEKNSVLAKHMVFVGSLKEDGKTPSCFSNLPGALAQNFLFAPGENVVSTVAFNNFSSLSGTSMATPHVSGILTLMSKYYPSLSALELKECLLGSCDKFWQELGFEQNDREDIFGRGRVNAVAAFKAAEELSQAKSAGISGSYPGMEVEGGQGMDMEK